MADGEYEKGLQASRFSVTIDGVDLGRFSQVSGISYNVNPITSQQTNAEGQLVEYSSPGSVDFNPISMTRILTEDNALLDWHKQISEDGATDRKTGSVVMYDRAGAESGRWNFEGAWVMQWSCSPLMAAQDGFLEETVVLSVDRVYREGA